MVRTGWSSSQPSHPSGQWACDQGYKKIAAIGADYAFGYEVVGGFQRAFEACGGEILQKILPPIGPQGFGPDFSTLRQDSDTIFQPLVRATWLAFPEQPRGPGRKKTGFGAA